MNNYTPCLPKAALLYSVILQRQHYLNSTNVFEEDEFWNIGVKRSIVNVLCNEDQTDMINITGGGGRIELTNENVLLIVIPRAAFSEMSS